VSNTPRLIVNLFEFAIHASQDSGEWLYICKKAWDIFVRLTRISENVCKLWLQNIQENSPQNVQKIFAKIVTKICKNILAKIRQTYLKVC